MFRISKKAQTIYRILSPLVLCALLLHAQTAYSGQSTIPDGTATNMLSCSRTNELTREAGQLVAHYLIPTGSHYNVNPWDINLDSDFNKSILWNSDRLEFDAASSYRLGTIHGIRFALFGALVGPFWLLIRDQNNSIDVNEFLGCKGFQSQRSRDKEVGYYTMYNSKKFFSVIYLKDHDNDMFCIAAFAHDPSECGFENFHNSFKLFHSN